MDSPTVSVTGNVCTCKAVFTGSVCIPLRLWLISGAHQELQVLIFLPLPLHFFLLCVYEADKTPHKTTEINRAGPSLYGALSRIWFGGTSPPLWRQYYWPPVVLWPVCVHSGWVSGAVRGPWVSAPTLCTPAGPCAFREKEGLVWSEILKLNYRPSPPLMDCPSDFNYTTTSYCYSVHACMSINWKQELIKPVVLTCQSINIILFGCCQWLNPNMSVV